MRFKKKGFSNLELEGQGQAIIMGVTTSARAILHHTDQNGQNILKGSVSLHLIHLVFQIFHMENQNNQL